jgi:hypothetical protein
LWKAIHSDLLDTQELDRRELTVLAAAGRQHDLNAKLERAVKRDGVTVTGAAGQTRLNGCVTELRNGYLALARLLDHLDLTEVEAPATARARHAATARWNAERAKRGRAGVAGG